jgi:hypothetical protein
VTVAKEPDRRGEREATVNHCAGMPGDSGVTVAHYAHVFAAGASAPGIPAPSDRRAKENSIKTSGAMRREIANLCFHVTHIVVPANAGTHNPGRLSNGEMVQQAR